MVELIVSAKVLSPESDREPALSHHVLRYMHRASSCRLDIHSNAVAAVRATYAGKKGFDIHAQPLKSTHQASKGWIPEMETTLAQIERHTRRLPTPVQCSCW